MNVLKLLGGGTNCQGVSACISFCTSALLSHPLQLTKGGPSKLRRKEKVSSRQQDLTGWREEGGEVESSEVAVKEAGHVWGERISLD